MSDSRSVIFDALWGTDEPAALPLGTHYLKESKYARIRDGGAVAQRMHNA